MTTPCDRAERWLEATTDPATPPADLRVHAEGCEPCRRSLAADAVLRDALGDIPTDLDSARRAALSARALEAVAAPPSPRPRVRLRRWFWAAPAAVAAAVVVALLLRPAPVHPIPPTDLFADLLGPLTEISLPPERAASAAPAGGGETPPIQTVLSAFWEDFAGPVAIGRGAVKAHRAAAAIEPVETRP